MILKEQIHRDRVPVDVLLHAERVERHRLDLEHRVPGRHLVQHLRHLAHVRLQLGVDAPAGRDPFLLAVGVIFHRPGQVLPYVVAQPVVARFGRNLVEHVPRDPIDVLEDVVRLVELPVRQQPIDVRVHLQRWGEGKYTITQRDTKSVADVRLSDRPIGLLLSGGGRVKPTTVPHRNDDLKTLR